MPGGEEPVSTSQPPLGTGPLPLRYTHTKKDRISYATGFAYKVPLQILEFIEQKQDTHALIRTIGTALNVVRTTRYLDEVLLACKFWN